MNILSMSFAISLIITLSANNEISGMEDESFECDRMIFACIGSTGARSDVCFPTLEGTEAVSYQFPVHHW